MVKQLPFSDWFKFEDYKKHNKRKLPGVYILAHFDEELCISNDLLSDKIVYIGETTTQTIHKRLYQFSNSAFKRKIGHSGGWTYSEKYLNSIVVNAAPENLYVSFLSVNKEKKESKAYIKYIERLLIWEYFKKFKDYPPCNKA